MRLLRVPVALLLSLSVPGVAFAQVPPPPKAPAEAKPEPAPEPEPEPELSEEEKEEKAKNLYIEAEGLAAEGNWADAVPLYEQAYYLVPGKHGFAHKVGIATWKIGNCDKTKEYLTHFVTYAEGDKYADKIAEAQAILDEIEERQCATEPEPEPEPEAPKPVENPLDSDNPLAGEGGEDTGGGDKAKKNNGLLIGGAVLMVLGVGGIGAGAAGAAMASGAGTELNELSGASVTGYPAGDYSCRTGECPPDIESRLQTGKILTGVGFAAGGALLVTGVALIAVHAIKKKKAGGGAAASAPRNVQLTAAGPMLVPGGGGAMAGIRF